MPSVFKSVIHLTHLTYGGNFSYHTCNTPTQIVFKIYTGRNKNTLTHIPILSSHVKTDAK